MSFLLSRFRGLGIALAVLAISAGAVFAAAPPMTPVSHDGITSQSQADDPSESPSESPEASESESPSASPSESPAISPDASPAASPSESASPDNHGALVSTAAQMPTPSGFPNHGAWVSCVAHMNVSVNTVDWTTVTPDFCGITPTGSSQPTDSAQTQTSHGQGAANAAAGKAHGHSKGHGNPHNAD